MIRSRSIFVVAAVAFLALAGCRSETVQNVESRSYSAAAVDSRQSLTLEDYERAILRAGAKRGWAFKEVGPGQLEGTVNVRGKHQATVDVFYTDEDFSIIYKNSQNLNYKSDTRQIHKNYNTWVRNLENDIQQEVLVLHAS